MGGLAGPGKCVKGAACLALDKLSGDRDGMIALQDAIAGIASAGYAGLENVLGQFLLPALYSAADAAKTTTHLKACWFDPSSPTCYFPGVDVAKIYGQGLLKTLELSLKSGAPVDTWWVRDHAAVEMLNLASPRQVTLIIATPRLADGQLAP
jgi:hypothetical protein